MFMQNKDSFIVHRQYHGSWWPGEARNQGISNHGIDQILTEYPGLGARKVRSVPCDFKDQVKSIEDVLRSPTRQY